MPYTGASPIEQGVDHLGPMAATSADCALLLEVIAGFDDGRDPRQTLQWPVKPYAALLDGGVRGLRIGVVREGFGTKAHRIPPADAALDAIVGHALDMVGNTSPFNATGHPAISVPVGFSAGLPVGLMLSGRRGEDDVVLRAGHACERL